MARPAKNVKPSQKASPQSAGLQGGFHLPHEEPVQRVRIHIGNIKPFCIRFRKGTALNRKRNVIAVQKRLLFNIGYRLQEPRTHTNRKQSLHSPKTLSRTKAQLLPVSRSISFSFSSSIQKSFSQKAEKSQNPLRLSQRISLKIRRFSSEALPSWLQTVHRLQCPCCEARKAR